MLDERAIKRFWDKVIVQDGCWGWKGTVYGSNGYSRMWTGEKAIGGHRFSWLLHKGAIPDGLLVLHRCDNPVCTNPEHLWLGTDLDNIADRDAKGRTCKGDNQWQRKYPEKRMFGDKNGTRRRPETVRRGEAQNLSKVTDDAVRQIRSLYAAGVWSQAQLGTRFGLRQSAISAIISRKTWKHVE